MNWRLTHFAGILASASLLLTLMGCGPTKSQQRVAAMRSSFVEVMAANAVCRARAAAMPESSVFAAKMPIRADQPTAAQLADRSRISSSEGPAFQIYLGELRRCRDMSIAAINQVIPEISPVLEAEGTQTELNRARLLNGEITWGQANSEGLQIAIGGRANMAPILAAVEDELASQHQSEMNDRAVALQLIGGVLGAAAEGAAYGATAPRPFVYAPTYVRRR